MPVSRPLTVTILSVFMLALAASAHAVEYRPDTLDARIKVGNITQDMVELVTPYGFHEDYGYEPIFDIADWACGLYQRYAVALAQWTSDVSCDQMGAAQARREWTCEHYFRFACAIPDSPKHN